MMVSIMTELSTANSFVVRVYRVDTEDPHKLVGQLETLDGSGERQPFTDLGELATLLNRGAGKRRGRGKGAKA
ncbi:hypothetical protein [Geotalea uraniireducens]|uniref:hypothetical protein n=1 Tax=Geotalea uraniireducens TaxID=351604 RepID=UPI0002D7B5AD|nr:hypothetical protein [Geotalea uraniireducens]